jgi:hypothetical protein
VKIKKKLTAPQVQSAAVPGEGERQTKKHAPITAGKWRKVTWESTPPHSVN